MSSVTDEMRREHSRLVSGMMAIGETEMLTPEVTLKLRELYGQLQTHIAAEEREVYAKLEAAGASNPGLKRTLHIFIADTADITRNILDFFERYLCATPPTSFAKDFRSMFLAFRTRVRREEEILFDEVDKLSARA